MSNAEFNKPKTSHAFREKVSKRKNVCVDCLLDKSDVQLGRVITDRLCGRCDVRKATICVQEGAQVNG